MIKHLNLCKHILFPTQSFVHLNEFGVKTPAQLPLRCLTVSFSFKGMYADLAQTSMAAAVTTWLSPRFDRMNALSKAIKVSVVFACWDGWCFDDGDEKQYIDPERTVMAAMWQIFTELVGSLLLSSENWHRGYYGNITEASFLLYWQLGYIIVSKSREDVFMRPPKVE